MGVQACSVNINLSVRIRERWTPKLRPEIKLRHRGLLNVRKSRSMKQKRRRYNGALKAKVGLEASMAHGAGSRTRRTPMARVQTTRTRRPAGSRSGNGRAAPTQSTSTTTPENSAASITRTPPRLTGEKQARKTRPRPESKSLPDRVFSPMVWPCCRTNRPVLNNSRSFAG